MTSSDRPRGVFFDLGGTLFSYRNVPRTTMPLLLEVAERVGVETDVQQIREQYGQATSEVTERYAERDYYLHQDFFDDVLVRYCALLGSQCDQALRDWYLAAHREAIVHCLDLKDDCRSTLVKLREAQLYLSVVSNIDNDMLHPLIERENLGE